MVGRFWETLRRAGDILRSRSRSSGMRRAQDDARTDAPLYEPRNSAEQWPHYGIVKFNETSKMANVLGFTITTLLPTQQRR
jgi:hypothetical protein